MAQLVLHHGLLLVLPSHLVLVSDLPQACSDEEDKWYVPVLLLPPTSVSYCIVIGSLHSPTVTISLTVCVLYMLYLHVVFTITTVFTGALGCNYTGVKLH